MKTKTKQIIGVFTLIIMVTVVFSYQQYVKDLPTSFQVMFLQFTDGTNETVTSSSYQSLTIVEYAGGRTLLSLTVRLYVTATYVGPMTSYFIDGYARGSLYRADNNALQKTLWGPTYFSLSGTYLASGSPTLVSESTITGIGLQSLYTGWVNNRRYYYLVECPSGINVRITFPDGNSITRNTVPSQLRYYFTYVT